MEKNSNINELLIKGFKLNGHYHYNDAIEYFDEVLDKTSKTDLEYLDAYIGKAIALYKLNAKKEMIKHFNRISRINLSEGDAKADRGEIIIMSKFGALDKFAEAIYEKINWNESSGYMYNTKGIALRLLGKPLYALLYFDKAIELDPDKREFYFNKAKILFELREYIEALKYINKGIELDPHYNDAYLDKTKILLELGEYTDALISINKELEPDTSNKEGYFYKATILLNLAKYEEALVCINKALEIDCYYKKALNLKEEIEEEL